MDRTERGDAVRQGGHVLNTLLGSLSPGDGEDRPYEQHSGSLAVRISPETSACIDSGFMVTAALAYGDCGLAVFPVAADCRRPLTRHGYRDASNTREGIEALWRGRPEANIAVACGAVSGVLVLDVDVKGANGLRTLAELEARNGTLPKTWRTRTPSGGFHLWFRPPPRRLRNRVGFAPGLDLRTDGGSVAVPPSTKPGGVYAWEIHPEVCPLPSAPNWLSDLIDPPVVRPPVRPIPAGSYDRLARYVCSAINGECRELAAMKPNTGRNFRLFVASARLGALVGANLVSADLVERQLEAAAAECGLVGDDGRRAVLATIKSGLARGMAQPREVAW